MITPDTAQVVECYDTLSMAIDEIAETQHIPVAVVKATLMQFSKKYQSELSGSAPDDELEFSKYEQKLAKNALVNVLSNTEDECLKTSVAKFIRNDGKGRLDVTNMPKLKINVGQLNIAFQQAEMNLARGREKHVIQMPDKERALVENASK